MDIEISIIIAVYNAERYISYCLDSIKSQTFSDWECILIDDGSNDNSGRICDKYAKNDKRFKVIHQTNLGVVEARNKAIAIARGNYLTIVDSDDFLEKDFLFLTLSKAKEKDFDIVWSDYIEGNEIKKSIPDDNLLDNIEASVKKLISNEIKGFLWNKLFKRSFYMSCNIMTDKNCTMMEDKYMMLQILCNYPKMGYVSQPLYNYRIHGKSVTSVSYPLLKGLDNVLHMYEFLKDKDIWKTYENEFCKFAMLVKFSILEKDGINEARNFMSFTHKSIKNYPISSKIVNFYWFCFNYPLLGNIFYKIYRKKSKIL